MNSDAPRRGPGLAKTRGHRLFRRRALELRASLPAAMTAFVRAADVVSEGEVRADPVGPTYYGSTSLLLRPTPQHGAASIAELCARLAEDPHFRVLALRIAVREAAHRAGAAMGQASAEITFRETEGGAMVTVDLAAPLDTAAARSA